MLNENVVDISRREIKQCTYYIKQAIEHNNLKECLKNTNQMLIELKGETLTPREYNMIYIEIFDVLQLFQQSICDEELRKKKKLAELYDIVQHAKEIIPRIYLLICIGCNLIDSKEKPIMEVIKDIFNMIKGIQHPIKGLFVRYYLLKNLKDKIENNLDELDIKDVVALYNENLT